MKLVPPSWKFGEHAFLLSSCYCYLRLFLLLLLLFRLLLRLSLSPPLCPTVPPCPTSEPPSPGDSLPCWASRNHPNDACPMTAQHAFGPPVVEAANVGRRRSRTWTWTPNRSESSSNDRLKSQYHSETPNSKPTAWRYCGSEPEVVQFCTAYRLTAHPNITYHHT